jgi:hypothetical protein
MDEINSNSRLYSSFNFEMKVKCREAILVCEEYIKERLISRRTGSKCQERKWVGVPAKKLYFTEIVISNRERNVNPQTLPGKNNAF